MSVALDRRTFLAAAPAAAAVASCGDSAVDAVASFAKTPQVSFNLLFKVIWTPARRCPFPAESTLAAVWHEACPGEGHLALASSPEWVAT